MNGELSIRRLFTQTKPRIGNRLICLNDFVYNIGGREHERPQKSVERIAVRDFDQSQWETMAPLPIYSSTFSVLSDEEVKDKIILIGY